MPKPLSLKPREYQSQPSTPPLEDLSTTRFGLRFVSPRTEAAYRRWHAVSIVPFVRLGLVAAALAWAGALVGVLVAAADRAGAATLLIVAVNTPPIAGTFALTLSRRAHLTSFAVVLANCLSGLTTCALAFWLVNEPLVGTIGTIAVAFFGFTVFRLRTLYAVLASAPYIVTVELCLFRAGPGEHPTTWVISWVAVLVMWSVCIFIGFINEALERRAYASERTIEAQSLALEQERRRSDELLHSILPAPISERLKRAPGVIAEHFDQVTVLFADLVGFTPLAARLSPEEIVGLLDAVFTRFDRLAAAHGVEKVKTIGDAYMAVAGAPRASPDDAAAVARLALAMLEELAQLRAETGYALAARIGIASGPAVGGVIGAQKFAWDLWGDTVNTAARMESHGVVDRVQLAESTYARVSDRFACECRGDVEVKGKGTLRTWLLIREKKGTGYFSQPMP